MSITVNCFLLSVIAALTMAPLLAAETRTVTPREDTEVVLSNPDMGWVLYKNYPLDTRANGTATMLTLPGESFTNVDYVAVMFSWSDGGDGWAPIREAQRRCLTIPHTGMASALDVGDVDDIHPKNKFDVGERLALWALRNDYGQEKLVVSGPLYRDMKVENGAIRLSFGFPGSGLMVGKKEGRNPTIEDKNAPLKRFAIAGNDKKWFWANAVIEGNTIVVSAPEVTAPVAVRYAYTMNPAGANLYNREGLPASPFRTDGW